ncbi:Gmad2 immunoglobulin-like domain-containing protein [Propionibacteriaceae bacterium Y2011]
MNRDVTNLHGPEDEELEHALAGALNRQAEQIQPGHRFDEITSRTTATSRRPMLVGLVAAAGVFIVAIGMLSGVLIQRNNAQQLSQAEPGGAANSAPDPSTAEQPAPSSSTVETPPPAPSSTAPATPAPPGTIGGIPVYWIGADGKLHREFRTVPDRGERTTTAVVAMLSEEPLDPDYRSMWRPSTEVTITRDGDDLTVDLPAAAMDDTATVSRADATMAIQQLVWTATAAAQTPGTVTVLIDGEPGLAWGVQQVGDPVSRDGEARSTVWIIDPQHGDVRSPGTVKVTGNGTAFEGNLVWRVVRESDGTEVASHYVMAGANGEYGDFEFTFEVTEPGTYVIEVNAPDMSGQSDGVTETKTITVR